MASAASEAAATENAGPSLSRPFIQQLFPCLPVPGAGTLNKEVPRWLTFLLSPFQSGFSSLTVAVMAAHTYPPVAMSWPVCPSFGLPHWPERGLPVDSGLASPLALSLYSLGQVELLWSTQPWPALSPLHLLCSAPCETFQVPSSVLGLWQWHWASDPSPCVHCLLCL